MGRSFEDSVIVLGTSGENRFSKEVQMSMEYSSWVVEAERTDKVVLMFEYQPGWVVDMETQQKWVEELFAEWKIELPCDRVNLWSVPLAMDLGKAKEQILMNLKQQWESNDIWYPAAGWTVGGRVGKIGDLFKDGNPATFKGEILDGG